MNNKYIFSLREEISILATHNNPLYNYLENESAMNLKLGTNLQTYINTAYNTTSVAREGVNQFLESFNVLKWETNHYVLNNYIKEILDLFSSRFADECILKTNSLEPAVLKAESNRIFDKILTVLCNTYDKYKNLLEYYDRTKGELLRAIEDTYVDFENFSENSENSQDNTKEGTSYQNNSRQTNSSTVNSRNASTEGKSTFNDTPQNVNTQGQYGSEDFASNIEVANSSENESANGTTEGEENSQVVNADTEKAKIVNTGNVAHNRNLYHVSSHDRDTLMERLNQIDNYYQNVYRKWITEFEPLCWEVANYEKF